MPWTARTHYQNMHVGDRVIRLHAVPHACSQPIILLLRAHFFHYGFDNFSRINLDLSLTLGYLLISPAKSFATTIDFRVGFVP